MAFGPYYCYAVRYQPANSGESIVAHLGFTVITQLKFLKYWVQIDGVDVELLSTLLGLHRVIVCIATTVAFYV